MKKVILTAIILIGSATQSHAYLDPGTGSMAIQVLVACFAAVAIFFKQIWQVLRSIFGKSINNSPSSENEDEK